MPVCLMLEVESCGGDCTRSGFLQIRSVKSTRAGVASSVTACLVGLAGKAVGWSRSEHQQSAAPHQHSFYAACEVPCAVQVFPGVASCASRNGQLGASMAT